MPAPEGNHNRTETGMHTVLSDDDRNGCRLGMTVCRLPKKHRRLNDNVNEMRKSLEDATFERFQRVSVVHADTINLCCQHELARQYLSNRLRVLWEEGEPISLEKESQILSVIGRCADARSRAIKTLGLDAESDNFAFLGMGSDNLLPEPPIAQEATGGDVTTEDDECITQGNSKSADGECSSLTEKPEDDKQPDQRLLR